MEESYSQKWLDQFLAHVSAARSIIPQYWIGDDDPEGVKAIKEESIRLRSELDRLIIKIMDCPPDPPEFKNPIPTVDAIIMYGSGIILIKRKNPPYGWALPGGFVDEGESYEKAVAREVLEETGLHATRAKFFNVYSDPNRDPRGHFVSNTYAVSVEPGEMRAGDDAGEIRVFNPDELPVDMAFDHQLIIQQYIAHTFFQRPLPHEEFIKVDTKAPDTDQS